MLHASNLSRNVAKSRGLFYFSCNSQRCSCKMGCYTWIFSCNLQRNVQRATQHKERALLSASHPPKWWYRYVDDSHVCIAREHLTEFHSHLNSINEHIKFTVEEEKDGSIAFLDTMTTRNPDGTIKTRVYRKATHTDKYLQFNSHHQGGKRPGGETGSPLLGQCVMRRRTGTSAPSALPVQLMAAKNLRSTNRKWHFLSLFLSYQ